MIPEGATVAVGGAGAGHALPDLLLRALGDRFRACTRPQTSTASLCRLRTRRASSLQSDWVRVRGKRSHFSLSLSWR